MVTSDFTIKVADFGQSKFVNDAFSNTADAGALLFLAPEGRSSFYTKSVDLWSFGVVAGQILRYALGLPDPSDMIEKDEVRYTYFFENSDTGSELFSEVTAEFIKETQNVLGSSSILYTAKVKRDVGFIFSPGVLIFFRH